MIKPILINYYMTTIYNNDIIKSNKINKRVGNYGRLFEG